MYTLKNHLIQEHMVLAHADLWIPINMLKTAYATDTKITHWECKQLQRLNKLSELRQTYFSRDQDSDNKQNPQKGLHSVKEKGYRLCPFWSKRIRRENTK